MADRTARRFRPLTDALEGRAAVSSLMLGFSASPGRAELREHRNEGAATGRGNNTSGNVYQPVVLPSLFLTAKRTFASRTTTATAGSGNTTNWAIASATTAQHISTQVLVGSLVMVSTPSSPSATEIRPVKSTAKASPVDMPGSGEVSVNSTLPSTVLSNTASLSYVPANQEGGLTAIPGAIRALSMSPQATTATSTSPAASFPGTQAAVGTLAPMYSSGGSGGGPPPADKPPVLLASGGNWGGSFESSPGQFVDPYSVPIGAVITVLPQSPDSGYTVQSATWSGGTNYSNYVSQDAGNPPPASQTVGTGVATNQLTYGFIADSSPRAYTVSANVVYTNGAKGTSTITITTQAPTVSFSTFDQGTTNYYPPLSVPQVGGGAAIQYDNWAKKGNGPANVPDNSGVRFQATTSTTLGGSFMFLQTVQPRETFVIKVNGVTRNWTWTDGIGGTALDTWSGGNTLSYSTDSTSDSPNVSQWNMNANALPQKNKLSDTPYAVWSNATEVQSLQIGSGIPPGGGPPAPVTFQTYLMYRGSGGVWVAVAELDWSYSGGLTRNGAGNLVVDPNNPLSNPAPTQVAPPPIGPTWNGQGRNYSWQ